MVIKRSGEAKKRMARVTEKKNPDTEFFREAIRENIDLMRALAKNGRNK